MRLILLYSGGLDSSYVAQLLLHEGHEIIPLHAYIGRSLLSVAIRNLRKIASGPRTLYIADHRRALSAIVGVLRRLRAREYTCIACKTLMMLEASRLGEELGADGIVTGETLGQVASQTLPNMLLVHRYARLPVYTPLLSLDKHEASNALGALLEKTPSCPFLPKKPVTRPDPVLVEMLLIELQIERLADTIVFEKIVV